MSDDLIDNDLDSETAELQTGRLLQEAGLFESEVLKAFVARTQTAEPGPAATTPPAPMPLTPSIGFTGDAATKELDLPSLQADLHRQAESVLDEAIKTGWQLNGMTVTWKFLIFTTALMRGPDGRVRNLKMENVTIVGVPRDFWRLPMPNVAEILFGLRPGDGCLFKNVAFMSAEIPDAPQLVTRL